MLFSTDSLWLLWRGNNVAYHLIEGKFQLDFSYNNYIVIAVSHHYDCFAVLQTDTPIKVYYGGGIK